MRTLLVSVAVAAMAAAGHCQSRPPDPGAGTPAATDPRLEAKQQALEAIRQKEALTGKPVETRQPVPPARPSATAIPISPADRDLSPEELRKKYKQRLGAAYVDYAATTEPAVLEPGASGTMAVMMLLKQDAIMRPIGPSQIDVPPAQGKLALGTPKLRPATPAKRAEAVLGKACFEDFAVIDIPVTVAADAAAGAHAVKLDLTYELYKGKTGGWIERFLDHVDLEVQVGKAPVAAANAADPVVAQQNAPASGAPLDGNATDAGDADNAGAHAATGTGEASPFGSAWIAVAGGIVLAILLLLLRRRAG